MADDDLSPAFLGEFVRAIAILALPAESQIAWIDGLGVEVAGVDELALEFDDGFRLLPQFLERHWLSDGLRVHADEIDRLLTQMSGPQGPWSVDELRSDPRWADVRSRAAQALSEIGGSTFIQ
jgi:hypothetical protein